MGLEVREVGPIETPRHRGTVYFPATTVAPTVVAIRPERAKTVARAQFSPMGIDPGRRQPMQIIPSMHVKSPEAIITDEEKKLSYAQRAAPAEWRAVGRRLPRPLGRASALSGSPTRLPAGPACRARRVGYAPRMARASQRGRPLAQVPASPPCRPPPPLASPPPVGYRVPRRRRRPRGGPLPHRGPRSIPSPSAEMEPSPATPFAGLVGAPSPASPSCPSTAAAAPEPASASVAPTTSGPPGRRPIAPGRPLAPPGMRLP